MMSGLMLILLALVVAELVITVKLYKSQRSSVMSVDIPFGKSRGESPVAPARTQELSKQVETLDTAEVMKAVEAVSEIVADETGEDAPQVSEGDLRKVMAMLKGAS